ncbi:MAG: TonB-dependent receptor plug domain-containing protein [Bacteroidetes bacterium]|nr:TonB-dependent receptor plug domain-containing protein [Bacteroidota bacterium]
MLSIYHALKSLLLSFFLCVLFVNGNSQSELVHLTVRAASDSTAIEYATITIYDGSGRQFIADANGLAKVDIITPSKISIYKRGFLTQSITLTSVNTNIYLKPLEIDLPTVEIKSTGLQYQTAAESAYQVKVIDKKQIEQKASTTLNDVLLTQPGMRITQDPILGSNLQLNGLGGQNVKVMVDGIPVNGRENGNIDLNQLTLQNVSGVEIIEGPLSSIYGSDALGGVINIITASQVESPLLINVNGKYESVGNYNTGIAVGGGSKNAWYNVSGARNFFDGYPDPGTQRTQLWNPRVQYVANAGAGYRFNKSEIRIKSSYLDETIIDKNAPTITPYEAYAFDDRFFTRRASADMTYSHSWNNKKSIKVTGAYNSYLRQKTSYRKDLVTLENKELPSDLM